MNINTIESINNAFYQDPAQRKYHISKAKETYQSIKNAVTVNTSSVLALNRSWMSEMMVDNGIKVSFPNDITPGKKFSLILALDEMLTREADEQIQRKHIMQLIGLLESGGMMVCSLRDFRNTNCHRRPMGDSCLSVVDRNKIVTSEINDLDDRDKQLWRQKLYVIANDMDFECLDLGMRRTLYFKQLAKYCADAGAQDFGIFKDVYWRNHLRRTPEHVAWVRMK